MTTTFINEANSHTEAEIMIDSGAATHVCPPWFEQNSPLYTLQQGQGPSLRTATDEKINMYGYKWALMANNDNYKIVVPFYVCDVKQPIMSVTKLTEQGFNIQLKDTPTMSHGRGFHSSEAGQHSRQHETRHQHDWNNRISSNYTSDHYTKRTGRSQNQE